MIQGVLFDLDGTLVQYSASYADFMREIASACGISSHADPFFEHYAAAIRAEGVVTFRSSIESALSASGRSLPRNIVELTQTAVADYAKGIELLPGALELLARYDGLPKAIVSNGPSDMQRAAIASANLAQYFDHILISGDADVAVRKPNPKIFLQACASLGVAPSLSQLWV